MVDSIKGFRQVKKNTAYSFIAVHFHFKIVSEFKNCLLSEIIFPEAKLAFTYQTHCDICPMSHRVVSTSGKIELKTRYFLQNKTFLSQSRRCITNAPPVLSQVLSKLLVVKNTWVILSRFRWGIFIFFPFGLDVNLQKRDRS